MKNRIRRIKKIVLEKEITINNWHLHNDNAVVSSCDNYYIDKHTDWYLKETDRKIKSPLAQVKSYKDNLYDLHINDLLQNCLENRNYRALVNTMVYFHFHDKQTVSDYLFNRFDDKKFSAYKVFHKYIKCWGKC